MPGLVWDDVTAITYTEDDKTVTFTPEQLSVIVQMVALFNSSEMWDDYTVNSDDIDAMVSELSNLLTEGL